MMIVMAACRGRGVLRGPVRLGQVLDREQLRDAGPPHPAPAVHHLADDGRRRRGRACCSICSRPGARRDPLLPGSSASASCIWFVRNWQKEFVFLMGLRDGDFPGRHDKLIWAVVLTAFAPVGVWFFRAYRLAHWPEPAPAIDPERGTEESEGAAAQPGLSRAGSRRWRIGKPPGARLQLSNEKG